MKTTVIAFDLDGTVMHSGRRHRRGDVCIEWINGEECGFMRREMQEALSSACKKAELIPVTSRSVAQYRRIRWPDSIAPKTAFVDNGAMFLADYGVSELRLKDKTIEFENRLNAVAYLLAKAPFISKSRVVDEAYVLGIIEEDAIGHFSFDRFPTPSDFYGLVEGKKAYLFPVGVTKGAAVRRIRELFPDCYLIAAGNALNDASMLYESDFAFGTTENKKSLPDHSVLCPAGSDFEECVAAGLNLLMQIDWDKTIWGKGYGLAI